MLRGLSARLDIKRDVVALSLARLGDAIGNSLLFVVIPLYVARMPAPWFPFSETIRVGILISAYGVFSAIGEPLSGALIDRAGRSKLMIQLGLAVMAGSLLAYIPVHRHGWLLALRCVQGIGLAITVPAALALMAAITRTETRGRAMGFYSAMRMLGIAIGPLVGGFVQVRFGFSATFIVGAACVALTILLVEVWVSEPHRREAQEPRAPTGGPGFFDRRIWSSGVVGSGVAMLSMASAFTLIATLEKQFNQML
ncbi:MAG: MFS transporter [Steroidobacteraceae bacterium]